MTPRRPPSVHVNETGTSGAFTLRLPGSITLSATETGVTLLSAAGGRETLEEIAAAFELTAKTVREMFNQDREVSGTLGIRAFKITPALYEQGVPSPPHSR